MSLKILIQLFCFSLFFGLGACTITTNNQIPVKTYQRLEVKISGYRHAQIIQRGEYLRIILYKDLFFEPLGTKIKPNRFQELTMIAELLKMTGDRPIIITGHVDGVKSEQERLAESDILARNIAGYLWSKGIPYERMQVTGLSNTKLIAEDDTPFGSAFNRRVEIRVPFEALLERDELK